MEVKRQPTEQEKISANCVSDKGLASGIYKEFLQLNKNTNQSIKNQAKDWNRHSSKILLLLYTKIYQGK